MRARDAAGDAVRISDCVFVFADRIHTRFAVALDEHWLVSIEYVLAPGTTRETTLIDRV
jgi:hypothetical protein